MKRRPTLNFSQLDELAAKSPQGARGLRLRDDAFSLPTDEMFERHTAEHQQSDEVCAILEGVAFQLRRQVDTLCGGAKPNAIRCAGGGAKSALWRSIKQQILGIPIITTQNPEPVAFGAGALAICRLKNQALLDLIPILTPIRKRMISRCRPLRRSRDLDIARGIDVYYRLSDDDSQKFMTMVPIGRGVDRVKRKERRGR